MRRLRRPFDGEVVDGGARRAAGLLRVRPEERGHLRLVGAAVIAPEVHHAVPQCLLRLHDAALNGEGVEAWIEFELEAERWRVPVEIPRGDLEALVASSGVVLEREGHRLLHASDWRRWGARGGRETVRRYGSSWMALLALKRWGRITAAELDAARALR